MPKIISLILNIVSKIKILLQIFFAFFVKFICKLEILCRYLHKIISNKLNKIAFMKTFISSSRIFSTEFHTPKPVLHIKPLNFTLNSRLLTLLLGILLVTNLGSFLAGKLKSMYSSEPPGLYLSEKASMYVTDFPSFEMKVNEVADLTSAWFIV